MPDTGRLSSDFFHIQKNPPINKHQLPSFFILFPKEKLVLLGTLIAIKQNNVLTDPADA